MKKEKILKILWPIGLVLSGCAIGASVTYIIYLISNRAPNEQIGEEIKRLTEKIRELESENQRLGKENSRLLKKLEALLYHLGKIVASNEVKSGSHENRS